MTDGWSPQVLVAFVTAAGALAWQVVMWWTGRDRREVEKIAAETGILERYNNRIQALEAEIGAKEQARMNDNMLWLKKCDGLERRVQVLEAKVIALGGDPNNGGSQ